jgi:hypothetical protein
MTTNFANFFYELPREYLEEKLAEYKLVANGKHVPSLKAVRAITGYMGHRQRSMAKHGGIAVDESLEQQSSATGYSTSLISDVHRFLEWCGLEVRLKQGGGPKKQPTVRRLIAQIPCEDLNGKIPNLNEFYRNLNEKKHDLNGVFPDTPRELPRYIPRVCNSKDSTHTLEVPYLEEDFFDEEYGFTPKDVYEFLNSHEEFVIMELF